MKNSSWGVLDKRKGFRPLAVVGDEIIGYSKGRIYKLNLNNMEKRLFCSLPGRSSKYFLGNFSRLLERLLRTEPTHALVVGSLCFVCRRSEIFRIDLSSGRVDLDFTIPDGRKLLSFSEVSSARFGSLLVFGEYFSNDARNSVRIWARCMRSGVWQTLHEFPVGEIEHVHALKQIDGDVYILCGDKGTAASIWKSDSDFSNVGVYSRGRQTDRAAWIETFAGSLIYATDSQFEKNYVMQVSGESVSPRPLHSIAGSSIYMATGRAEIYFSTAVEGDSTGLSKTAAIVNRCPGPGIATVDSIIYCLNERLEMEIVFRDEKDWIPFYLGQFGVFTFPTGGMPDGVIVAYGVALKRTDGCCLIFKKDVGLN